MATFTGSTNKTTKFKLEVVETSYSINDNTSQVRVRAYIGQPASNTYMYGCSINVKVSCTSCSYRTISYSNSGTVYLYTDSWLYLGETTFTVPHNSDGSKSISISASMTNNVEPSSGSVSGSMTLTIIPRASSIAVSNYDLGQNISVVIGKKSNSFTSTLTYKIGNRTGTIVEKTSSSNYVWAMSSSLIEQIKKDNPTNKKPTATIYCDTYSGNTKIGDTQPATFTFTITDKPVISSAIRKELNTNVSALTSKVLRHVSLNQFTIEAEAPVGSTIASYRIKNGTQDSGNSSTNIVNLNDIQSSYTENNTLKTKFLITCTDGRGNTSDIYEFVEEFIDYVDVSINKTDTKIHRSNNTVNDAILNIRGNFYNNLIGELQNELIIRYKYRLQGTSDFSELIEIAAVYENNTFKISDLLLDGEFDYQKNYEFVFYVNDSINVLDYYEYIYASSVPTEIHHSKGAYIRELDTDVLNLGEVPIVESGSNENGEWIKWANGFMICTKNRTFQATCQTPFGVLFESEQIDFGYMAQSFIEVPKIFPGNVRRTAMMEGLYDSTNNHFGRGWIMRPLQETVEQTYTIYLLAVGWWKKLEEGE